jgi:hypothetical protein
MTLMTFLVLSSSIGEKELVNSKFCNLFCNMMQTQGVFPNSHKKDVKFHDGTKMSSWNLTQDEINLHKPKGG